MASDEKCRWVRSKTRNGEYRVECGGYFNSSLKRWIEEFFKFCPYCGNEIEEVRDGGER